MINSSEPERVAQALRGSEARLQALISSLDDLVFELDENGIYLGIWTENDALLVAPRGELLGRRVTETLGSEVGLGLMRVISTVLETGHPEIWEFCLEVPVGVRWFESRVAQIAISEGCSRRVCLLVRDITEQKAAEQEISRLLSREQLLSQLSAVVPVGLFEIDMDRHIRVTNDRMRAIIGDSSADTVEALMSSVVVAEDRPVFEAALGTVFSNQPVDDLYLRLRLAAPDSPPASDNEAVWALSLRALTDATGVIGVAGCLNDVTDRAQLHRELEVKASVDKLTSCLNREASLELVEAMTAAPKPLGQGNAVIFVDLDHFKSVNDRFGHAAGDRLLVETGERLRGAARKGDAVGRVGGDEFIVICPRVQSAVQAVRIAERVAAATTATVDVGAGVAELRTSVGVAWTTEMLDADTFLAQADSAMYESKRTGRRGVTLFTADRGKKGPLESGALRAGMSRRASDKRNAHP